MKASMPVVSCSPPPALPPKKRQSAPSPTRVAVVAPMSRATSGSSLPVGINRQVMASPLSESQGKRAVNYSKSLEKCHDLQPCSSLHASAHPKQLCAGELWSRSFSDRNVSVINNVNSLIFFTVLLDLMNKLLQLKAAMFVAECDNVSGCHVE